MCGSCASDGSMATPAVDPYARPPRSPYYEAHMARRRSLPARLWAAGWKYAAVAAALSGGFWYLGNRPEGPEAARLEREWAPEQPSKHQHQHQRQISRQQVGIPLNLNLTRRAEPFWQGYRELLLFNGADVAGREDAGEGGWLDDVNADTTLIAEMWSKVERPATAAAAAVDDHGYDHAFHGNKVLGSKAHGKMEQDIHARAAALRNASIELTNFLGNRTRLVRQFVSKGAVWQQGDGDISVGGSTGLSARDLASLGRLLRGSPPPPLASIAGNSTANSTTTTGAAGSNRTVALSLEDIATYDDATAGPLARTAEGIMRELVLQHAALLEPLEKWHGQIARLCHVTLPAARTAETRFIKKLVSASKPSAAAERWSDGKRSIRALEHRACELHRKLAEMRQALAWLEGRFVHPPRGDSNDGGDGGDGGWYKETLRIRDGHGKKRDVPELLVWVQGATELLGAWSTVLMDVEEGVLIALRKREVAEKKRDSAAGGDAAESFDYDADWSRWKLRNCGGTSCFDETTPATRFKHIFFGKKPLAGKAWDERNHLGWGDDVKIWRGVYEKACCENGTLAKRLKVGEKTPDFVVEPHLFAHDEL